MATRFSSRKRRAEAELPEESDDDDFHPLELETVLRKRGGALPLSSKIAAAATTKAGKSKQQKQQQRVVEEKEQEDEEEDEEQSRFDAEMDDMLGVGARDGGEEEEEQEAEEGEDHGEEEAEEGEDDDLLEVGVPNQLRASAHKRDPLKPFACNLAGLHTKLIEISLPSSWPWIESFSLHTPHAMNIPDPHDDLQREAQFYQGTLAGVKQALIQLEQAQVPYIRPADYYAEMLKPDAHMARVKDALIREKSRMTAVLNRKKEQDSRKFSKSTQVAKLQAKQAEKKAHLAGLKSQQNAVKRSAVPVSEHSTVPGIDEAIAANKAFDQEKHQRKNYKREAKDKKYGFGGKKKRVKTNDQESARDVSGFRSSMNRSSFGGMSDHKPRRGERSATSFATRSEQRESGERGGRGRGSLRGSSRGGDRVRGASRGSSRGARGGFTASRDGGGRSSGRGGSDRGSRGGRGGRGGRGRGRS